MSDFNVPVDNVMSFLSAASSDIGLIRERHFHESMYSDLVDLNMKSPIEHLFWIGFHVMCQAHYIDLGSDPIEKDGSWQLGYGVHIRPQAPVGKYKVDFVVEFVNPFLGNEHRLIAVELDGHAFHDKDKSQRAYEKGRDRYLVKQGYQVLHFTGSEVVEDPYRVAHEVLDVLKQVDHEFDSNNPFRLD